MRRKERTVVKSSSEHTYKLITGKRKKTSGMCVRMQNRICRVRDMTILVRYEGDKTRGAGKLDYCGVLR